MVPAAAVRQVVEPRLEAIRDFTGRTASRCGEVRSTGLAAQISGTVPASPAQGEPISQWPETVQVHVGCFWWSDAPGGIALGNEFQPLRQLERPSNRSSVKTWEITRSFFGSEPSVSQQEEAQWPSLVVTDRDTVDVQVHRPLEEDAGYIMTVVTLRRHSSS